MTRQEHNTIESIAWQQLRNCKFYEREGKENCLKYEIGRLMSTIHIMIEMGMQIEEILEASKEFNKKQIEEKLKEGH